MGNIYSIIQKKMEKEMEQLCEHIDDSILFSLLLIRQLSQEDISLPFYLTESDFQQIRYHLWDIVWTNQEGDYISSITRALSLIESQFPFVHKLIDQMKKQNVKEDSLRQLISLVSNISAYNLPLVSIYESYLRKKFPMHKTTAALGDFYTPQSIAQCLATMLAPDQGTVYDPCCGSGALLYAAQRFSKHTLKLYGQTQDEDSYLLSQMSLILYGIYVDLGKTAANTLLDDQHKNKKFDYIIANPPFNSTNWFQDNTLFFDDRWCFGIPPHSNANFAWLQHILSHLSPNGRAAVILPNGTLTTQTGREAGIREAMIRNKLVEAIITLPEGLFYHTKVPCCIWLLTNTDLKREDILFIDAVRMTPAIKREIMSVHVAQLKERIDEYRQGNLHTCTEWYGVASLETIEKNGFLLSPNLYTVVSRPKAVEVRKEYEKLIELIDKLSVLPMDEDILSSIVAWKNMDAAKSWEKADLPEIYDVFGGVTKSKGAFGKGFPVLDVKTVIHTPYVPESFSLYVDVTEEERKKYGIRYGDVFLNRTSETIKELACCCVALEDQDAVYSGFIKRLRPCGKQTIDPLYAACFFRSEIYRWEVEDVTTVYTTYASIDNKKLSKIAVYFPDIEMQKKIGSILFEVFQFKKQCSDELQRKLLEEFDRLLIQQYITYPILCIQNKEGDDLCK